MEIVGTCCHVNRVCVPNGGSGAEHIHLFEELVVVECGRCRLINGGEEQELSGAFLIYTPRRTPHEQINDEAEPYARYTLLFDRELQLHAVELPDVPFAFELDDAELSRLLQRIVPLWELQGGSNECYFALGSANEARRDLLISLLTLEVSELAKGVISGRTRTVKSVISDVCDYIDGHYRERLELDSLAARFFLSRTKLTREFRSQRGMSVGEYVTSIRIARSKRLLAESRLPLEDIAHSCGFSSGNYFIKVFERMTGMSPTGFRQRSGELGELY